MYMVNLTYHFVLDLPNMLTYLLELFPSIFYSVKKVFLVKI